MERPPELSRRTQTAFAGALAVGLAAAVFALGASVYLFDRPDVLLLGSGLGSSGSQFGPLSDSLPSFAHTFAFTTWIAVAAGGEPRAILCVAASWVTVASTFELAQSPGVQRALEAAASLGLPSLAYRGVFDIRDLAAIWIAGALAAALVLWSQSARTKSLRN